MPTEQVQVTLTVGDVLEQLGVPYFIGGSMAGAVHGVIRATMDTDIIADLQPGHAEPLVSSLGIGFFTVIENIRSAIFARTTFSVVHMESTFKVDIFLLKERAFGQSEMQRRALHVISTDPDRSAYVASAEDTILAKLEWFRLGGEMSENQWLDVLGILKVQAGSLDTGYLHEWAGSLAVRDLLEKALVETGG